MASSLARLNMQKSSSTVLSCRLAHADVHFPDMESYRRDVTKDATKPARETEDQRRAFSYAFQGSGLFLGLYMGKGITQTVVNYKSMSADQMAFAKTEVNMLEIAEGVTKTVEYRGMPVFVRHRTQGEIDGERAVNVSELRDPQSDEERALYKPDWVVTMGVCTHLGCVPIAGMGNHKGGYYCPCHGSHYDSAGRIRSGPAPLNLEIPEHAFVGENLLVIGS
jgi:ubiquinol-cytochrome c reductase iron-sulfur subunit